MGLKHSTFKDVADAFEKYDLTQREIKLIIFALGRLDNLIALLATDSLSKYNFTKEDCRDLAKKLGAKIVVGNLDE